MLLVCCVRAGWHLRLRAGPHCEGVTLLDTIDSNLRKEYTLEGVYQWMTHHIIPMHVLAELVVHSYPYKADIHMTLQARARTAWHAHACVRRHSHPHATAHRARSLTQRVCAACCPLQELTREQSMPALTAVQQLQLKQLKEQEAKLLEQQQYAAAVLGQQQAAQAAQAAQGMHVMFQA